MCKKSDIGVFGCIFACHAKGSGSSPGCRSKKGDNMSVEIITFFSTLMKLAKDVNKAKKTGDKEQIRLAEEKHENYRSLCLKSDKMVIPDYKD
jgi:hypothetical protein